MDSLEKPWKKGTIVSTELHQRYRRNMLYTAMSLMLSMTVLSKHLEARRLSRYSFEYVDREMKMVAADDDSGEGSNALLFVRLPLGRD